MISRLSNKLSAYLLQNSLISGEDVDLYSYGLYILLSHLYYFLLACIVGILLNVPFEGAIFYMCFGMIRKYAGGIHASDENTCLLVSSAMVFTNIILIRTLKQNLNIWPFFLVLIFCGIINGKYAPVDSADKKLSQTEKHHYRKISHLVICTVVMMAFFAGIFNLFGIYYSLVLSQVMECILICIAVIKNKYFGTDALVR